MQMLLAGLLFCVGFELRLIAIRTLGDDFQLVIQVPSRIVKTGIYRYLKHPSYLGSLLMILGGSLLSPVVGIMLISYFFFKARMVVEDQIIENLENYIR